MINGHHYAQLKYYFAKYLIEYEKRHEPRWNLIINQRYSSYMNFDRLCQILQMKNIDEWEIGTVEESKKLTLSFVTDGIPYVIKGSEFNIIIKQLP